MNQPKQELERVRYLRNMCAGVLNSLTLAREHGVPCKYVALPIATLRVVTEDLFCYEAELARLLGGEES